jgi:hypothetical protein
VSANRVLRLHAVGKTGAEVSTGDVPMEILRFVALPDERRTLLMQVSDLLEQIDHGAVVVVMHEGKVTQIEMSEKIRLSRGPSGGDDEPRRS